MNSKAILSTVVMFLLAFFGGWGIYGVLLEEFFQSNISEAARAASKNPPVIWAIAVVCLLQAILFAWALIKSNSTTFMRGLQTSLLIGFLLCMIIDINQYAFADVYSEKLIITDVIVGTLFWGIVGGVGAAILGSGNRQ